MTAVFRLPIICVPERSGVHTTDAACWATKASSANAALPVAATSVMQSARGPGWVTPCARQIASALARFARLTSSGSTGLAGMSFLVNVFVDWPGP